MKQSYTAYSKSHTKAAEYLCLFIPLEEVNPPQKVINTTPAFEAGGRIGKIRMIIEFILKYNVSWYKIHSQDIKLIYGK